MVCVSVQSITDGLDDVVQIRLLYRPKQAGLHLSELPFARAAGRSVICGHTDPDRFPLGEWYFVLIPRPEEGVTDLDFIESCLVRCDGPELLAPFRQIRPCSALPLWFPGDKKLYFYVTCLLSHKIQLYPGLLIQRTVVYEFRV